MNRALNHDELSRRKPVWTALSELWLDTEINETELRDIANILASSGYPIPELREIYLYEVALVVCNNLLIAAGVWEGFDLEWLHTEARKNAEHRSLMLRLRVWFPCTRELMTCATEAHWLKIVHLLNAASDFSVGNSRTAPR